MEKRLYALAANGCTRALLQLFQVRNSVNISVVLIMT